MMTETKRHETAKECAGVAIEALFSVYWADSFDADLLQERLTDTIHTFTRTARGLEEAPDPEWVVEDQQAAHSCYQS